MGFQAFRVQEAGLRKGVLQSLEEKDLSPGDVVIASVPSAASRARTNPRQTTAAWPASNPPMVRATCSAWSMSA